MSDSTIYLTREEQDAFADALRRSGRMRQTLGLSSESRMRERAASIADASAAEYRAFAAKAEARGFYRLAGEQHGAANDAERIAALIRALPLEDGQPTSSVSTPPTPPHRPPPREK